MSRILRMPVANPVPRDPSLSQIAVGMFWRAFSMAILQAGGVTLIAFGSRWAGVTGFLISWYWIGNTRASVDHRHGVARFFYALGGCVGTLTVILLAPTLKRLLAHL